PVVFATWRAVRTVAHGETGLDVWSRYVASLPDGTVAQAEGAADVAALALWWAGVFPERVTRRAPGGGDGMLRAYVTFATQALTRSSRCGCAGTTRGNAGSASTRWDPASTHAGCRRESSPAASSSCPACDRRRG